MGNSQRVKKLEEAQGKGLFAVIIPAEWDSRIPKVFLGYSTAGEFKVISKEECEDMRKNSKNFIDVVENASKKCNKKYQ